MKILAVEDNALDARLLREYFREGQVEVHLEVVERLADATVRLPDSWDVVLLDLSLPDAHGPQTVAQVHAVAPNVPIVVLTGLDDEGAALRAMQEGAQDYLVKGHFEAPLLLRCIRYAVERKRAEEQSLKLAREQEARAEAEARAVHSRLVADVSRVLASSVDYRQTVPAVATLALPLLGDYCVIDVLDPTGEPRRLATSHVDPAREPLMAQLLALGAHREGPALSSRAFRQDEPLVMNVITEADLELMSVGGQFEILRELGPKSALAAPMRVRGRTIGALLFARCGPGQPYTPAEVGTASELAGRVALAIENSRLVRAREDMVSIVSHDLRTPLSVISLSAAALERDRGVPEVRARQLAKIQRSVKEMNRLIEDLLDVTRIEAGALPISLSTVVARELIDETVDRLKPVAEERNIQLATQVADEAKVLADRERCLQVFANIVSNAIKFTPPGGEVTLGVAPETGQVRFHVRDTGPGIREEDLPRVFDRFYQGSRESRRGAGLGLAIARGIIQAHGGRIWCESRLGEGSTFVFTLPAT